tara:strand:- start:1973 stop:2905 length:933 start_codon:yes stop_codon:yes gene_type:complete
MSIKRIVLSTTLSLLSQHALAAVPSNPVTVAQMHIAINKAVASISPGETYTAGTAISIINNIISGAYTPGAGIGISGAEISATPYTVSNGLTLDSSGFVIQGYQAGTNITIDTGTNPSTINATGGGTTVAVGDLYQGGIVYYVDATGQHGLAVSLQQTSNIPFTDNTTTTIMSNYGIGSGALNTSVFVAYAISRQEIGTAPQNAINYQILEDGISSCSSITSSTPTLPCYGGWFLGTVSEYQLISANFSAINTALTTNGGAGLDSVSYWTSNTEATDNQRVYSVNMSTGQVTSNNLVNGTERPFRRIRQF